MRKLCVVLFIAGMVAACAADDAPAKPGFLKRLFDGTKDGAGTVWDATKNAGKKTAKVISSPFTKKGGNEVPAAAAWRNLSVTMKLEPEQVRLPDTRAVDVTVSVVNTGKTAVQLEFPNSLRVDIVVKGEGGRVLSRWSDDQRIEREPGILLINPKERLEYSAKISTREMTAGKAVEIEAYFPSYEKLRTSRIVLPHR